MQFSTIPLFLYKAIASETLPFWGYIVFTILGVCCLLFSIVAVVIWFSRGTKQENNGKFACFIIVFR
jgi:F0F1-type ATP synthase assembly protein I